MRDRLHRPTLLSVLLGGLTLTGCTAGGALSSTGPTDSQAAQVRQQVARIVDGVTAARTIVHELAVSLDGITQVDAATKNRVDCWILQGAGTSTAASETVVTACRAALGRPTLTIPLTAEAPLPKALASLKTVSACPQLSTIVSVILEWAKPFIAVLETSTNSAYRMAGVGVRASLGFLIAGGGTCSA